MIFRKSVKLKKVLIITIFVFFPLTAIAQEGETITEEKNNIEELINEISRMRSILYSINKKLQSMEQNITEFQDSITEINTQNSKIEEKINGIEAKIKQYEKEITDIKQTKINMRDIQRYIEMNNRMIKIFGALAVLSTIFSIMAIFSARKRKPRLFRL